MGMNFSRCYLFTGTGSVGDDHARTGSPELVVQGVGNPVGLKTIILMMYIPLGLFIAALSVPLMRRKIPPNSSYGFRVRRTLGDPRVWYDVNAFTGRYMFRLGIGTSIATLALYFFPAINPVAYAVACCLILLLGVAVGVILSLLYLDRLFP